MQVFEQPGTPASPGVGAIWIDTDDTILPVGAGPVPTGIIHQFAGSTAPTGYALCDGSSQLRAGTYAALFAVIGTAYGSVDGTHFNLPNLKGKVPVGFDSGQTEFDTLGEAGGAKTHTLTAAQMPTHSHKPSFADGAPIGTYRTNTVINNPSAPDSATVYVGGTDFLISQDAGGGGSHPNLQPYVTLNYVIKL